MRLFVTDSGGFARRAVADVLSASHDVQLEPIGAKSTARPWSDPNKLAEQVSGCDCVVHFASAIPERLAVAESEKDRSTDSEKWRVVAGTENLLNACLASDVARFVLVSTTDISLHRAPRINWGEQREPPREQVVGTSARIARLADEITLGFNLRGIETITLRPAWLWGPGMPDPRSRKERATERGLRLIGSGENYVATTHVDNLSEAVLKAVEANEGGVGRGYYITDDDMIDAHTFFSELLQALGLPPPVAGVGLRAAYARAALEELLRGPDLWRADVIRRGCPTVFDTLAARSKLAWKPVRTFQEGIERLTGRSTPALRLV